MTKLPLTTNIADKPSLRLRTTHGIMWAAAQGVATRVTTLVQQLALAWLLSKDDFGLIGLAYTVTWFVQLMANPGIDVLLVKRQRGFRHWATPAFWLGLTGSLAGSVLMLVAAQIASWAYGQPRLFGLVAVLALALPIQALQIVPKAQLQMQMRFRAVAFLTTLSAFLTVIATVAAAYFGMGAYSFVVPVPAVAVVVSAASWWLARSPVRLRPEFSRWKYLFGTSATLFATQLIYVLDIQADNMALGLARFPEAAIGTYVMAYSVAVQSLRILSGSVMVVLFPSLSQLSPEPEKQVRAMLRATRLLVLVVVPACVLQVILSEPLFRLFLPMRWSDAVLPSQILTIGLMFNATCWPAVSLLMAQGRFREQLWMAVAGTLVFIAILGGAIWIHASIVSVAVGVAVWHLFNSPFYHWSATRHYAPRGSYLRETVPPLVAGFVAAVPCIILQKSLPPTIVGDLIAIVAGGLIFAATYLLLVYLLVPALLHDLRLQLAPYWERLRHPQGTPVADAAQSDGAAT